MNKFFKTLFFFLTLGVTTTLSAQIVYTCDFEDPTENAQWNLLVHTGTAASINMANNCESKWYIGAPGQFGASGQNGLFISSDNGQTATYTANNDYKVLAYRDLTLATGTYTINFDWRAAGKGTNARLLVYWMPQSQSISSHNTSSAIPSNGAWPSAPVIASGLYNQSVWRSHQATFNVTAATQQGRLLFIWACNHDTPVPPSACVDNICIYEGTPCAAAPKTVTYTNGNVTWSPVAGVTEYEVCVFNTFTQEFTPIVRTSSTSWTPTFNKEGYCNIYVRSICPDGMTSPWAIASTFVFIKGARCIDYMDLEAAKCYSGPFDAPTGPGSTLGKVDYGYASIESHHTIHYQQNEMDPRTQNKLPTIPAGEIASVRLGNWRDDSSIQGQGAAEAIEYKYQVKAGASDIMVLNYAVVMEKPGHNDGTDPHFLLEILDQRGNQIGGTNNKKCFSADFAASSNHPEDLVGWNEWDPRNSGIEGAGTDNILWKPWTTISVSLRNYVGQTLTIRFTTKDCRQSAHWAYAYFTIDCQSGDLQGIACGDFSTDHFDAPDGFNYEWYWAGDISQTNCLSRDQHFEISPTTDSIFICKVLPKTGDSNCGYELTANPNPRFPKVGFQHMPGLSKAEDCTHKLAFSNTSQIFYINRKDSTVMPTEEEKMVDEVIIDWGDGSAIESTVDALVYHNYPAEGGTFNIHVAASMNAGVCVDEFDTIIVLPNLKEIDEVHNYHRCNGQVFTYQGKDYTTDFSDTIVAPNKYGCDALSITNVYFHDVLRDTTIGHICEGEPFVFEGKTYYESGVDSAAYFSVYGCDSVHYLYLDVVPRLTLELPTVVTACGDDNSFAIPYRVTKGEMLSLSVISSDSAIAQGFLPRYDFALNEAVIIPIPEATRPNVYSFRLELQTPECAVEPITVNLELLYPTTIFDQKKGIVALLNEDYNGGGYRWVSYQWYRNGELMVGETGSYVLVDHRGDMNAHYTVVVTREDDGVSIGTCPYEYVGGRTDIANVNAVNIYPTILSAGQTITVETTSAVEIFDALGRLVRRIEPSCANQQIAAPSAAGIYILRVNNQNQRILVR